VAGALGPVRAGSSTGSEEAALDAELRLEPAGGVLHGEKPLARGALARRLVDAERNRREPEPIGRPGDALDVVAEGRGDATRRSQLFEGVWSFLGVQGGIGVTPEVFARARLTKTPGDQKVSFTDTVHHASIGAGQRVPVAMIPDPLRGRMNEQLRALGYAEVGDDWGSGPLDAGDLPAESELLIATLTLLMSRIRPNRREDDPPGSEFALLAIDRLGLRWVIDAGGAHLALEQKVPVTLSGSARDLTRMLRREENAVERLSPPVGAANGNAGVDGK
jgi:hypothetical protein